MTRRRSNGIEIGGDIFIDPLRHKKYIASDFIAVENMLNNRFCF